MNNYSKYAQTGLSPFLYALALVFFLLSFDRRTDGLCAVLTWGILIASVPLLWSLTRGNVSEILAPHDLPVSARLSLAGLFSWVLITGLSHFWSEYPLMTAESFFREILPQVGIFFLLIHMRERLFSDSGTQVRLLANCYSILAFIMIAILLLQTFFGNTLTAPLNDAHLILARPDESGIPWRLQFPCNTHNRAAFFCFIAVSFLSAALIFIPRPRRGVLWSMGLLCLFIAVFATMTRALILSLVIGIIILVIGMFLAHFSRRNTLLLFLVSFLLIAVGAWQFAPAAWRSYMIQPFTAQAWTPGKNTTTGMRLYIWEKTGELIKARPALGYGGGWEVYYSVFERAFPDARAEMPPREFPAHHSHNVPMQICFETGVIGMAAFLLFLLSHLATVLATAWSALRTRGHDLRVMSLVCAVELSMFAYIMTNYPMRRGMGLMMFFVWGVCYAATLNIRQRQNNSF